MNYVRQWEINAHFCYARSVKDWQGEWAQRSTHHAWFSLTVFTHLRWRRYCCYFLKNCSLFEIWCTQTNDTCTRHVLCETYREVDWIIFFWVMATYFILFYAIYVDRWQLLLLLASCELASSSLFAHCSTLRVWKMDPCEKWIHRIFPAHFLDRPLSGQNNEHNNRRRRTNTTQSFLIR